MQLIYVLVLMLLCSMGRTSYASENCVSLSLANIYDTSGVVVEVTNLTESLSFQEFKEYVEDPSESSEFINRDAFNKYSKEFEYSTFKINYAYKGLEQVDTEINVLGSSTEFIPGKRYIIFLHSTPIFADKSRKVFLFNDCALVDIDNLQIIWDSASKDTSNYKAFMNQLLFMKDNGSIPNTIPNITGKRLTMPRR